VFTVYLEYISRLHGTHSKVHYFMEGGGYFRIYSWRM